MSFQRRRRIFGLLLSIVQISNSRSTGEKAGLARHQHDGVHKGSVRGANRREMEGTCGGGSVGDGICADGSCCSELGFCGTSLEHCEGIDCGSDGGTCGDGFQGDGVCADGTCCSPFGWCGTSSAHCDGTKCGGAGPKPMTNSPTSTPPTSPPTISVSGSRGSCGAGSVGDGICADGSCCSASGFCGTSATHCEGIDCGSDGGTCGDGFQGDGVCADGSCCSPFGWCGTSSSHCDGVKCAGTPPIDTTIAPTSRPETNPFPPTNSPTIPSTTSNNNTDTPVVVNFSGIVNAFSLLRGFIEVSWDEASLLYGNTVTFDVFVALGDYDFPLALASMSVEELTEVFHNETTFRHYTFNDTIARTSIESVYYGELHTLLVTAQVDGIYSSNTASRKVVVSTIDPHIRDEINLVGMFIPTTRWTIELEEVPEGVEHRLDFSGAVSLYAQNLMEGDFITGLTSAIQPFVRRVTRVVESTPDVVILDVIYARIEEIFDELDAASDFEVSRHVNGISGRRRLFIGDFFNSVGDAFTAIGDAVVGVVEDIVETIVEIAGGEVLEEFDVIDIDEQWEYELFSAEGNSTGWNAKLIATGGVTFQVSLFARMRIAGLAPIFAEVGAKSQYSVEASMEMSAGIGANYSKDYELWRGRKIRRIFMVGVVPVQIYAKPKLELQLKADASLSVSSKVGARAQGGTEVSVIYDVGHNPMLDSSFTPPSLDPDYDLELEGEASVATSAVLVLSLDVGLYDGLLGANISLSAGISMDIAAGVALVEDVGVLVPTINRFDFSIDVSIPFSATAFYGELDIFETTLYEKKWPILVLPAVEIEILDTLRCVLGDSGASSSLRLHANSDYPSDALIQNGLTDDIIWYLSDEFDGWSTDETISTELLLEQDGLAGFSQPPRGTVTVVMQPRFPPVPLKIVSTLLLQSLLPDEGVQCTEAGPCDGDSYFDRLTQELGSEFDSQIFLSYQPDPSQPLVPSNVYKFEDFMSALKKLQNAGESFEFWLGDDCSVESQKMALVNTATFLGQAMRETIIYDACDENNWDMWRADIFKEESSPPENLPAFYPMSSGCGQLGQRYAEYSCPDECPLDLAMEQTATTNAAWIGAPPPLICGPKSKYDGLGYWNPQKFCNGPDQTCESQPFYYPGQTAGVHVPVSEDDKFPDFYYTNPLPDANGNTPPPRSPDTFPSTNVEGCCWWGRGVIQTTGRCNFGKLNKQIGAGAGSNALYPEVNFCQNPQSICDGPPDLKWVAGIFFWVSDPQIYDQDGFNYKDGVREFVAMGCADDPDRLECDFLFEYASGIVNRGCHDPGETGCPGCVPGATCDPAHQIPERVEASKQALKALMKALA